MKCAIVQPSYIPWRGFFHMIQQADVFVFFDDVQYTKKSWRSRNRIKTARGLRWLTIPIHSHGVWQDRTAIRDIRIDWSRPWNRSHRDALHQAYRKAPYYERCAGLLDELYDTREERLADFTIATTIRLARELGLERASFLRSSALGASGRGTERVLDLVQRLQADCLVNGPSAREWTDADLLARHGVRVEYMRYEYPEYPQLHGPFEPQVSILDLLVMAGPRAPELIWG